MNDRYAQVITDAQAERLHVDLLLGHPFLTRLAYYRLTHPGPPDLEALLRNAADPDGPFSDHLRALLAKLRRYQTTNLLAAMRQVSKHATISDDDTFQRLRGAGLVRREGRRVVAANYLYARFFGELL